ncbi:MAG TPA: 2OG-Fe(II) oxygenase family protein, partial [Sphingomonadales bacterium]|nr:2OG-Fe(II) oxygenase family protein [Sphingomonadales bacterium]
NHASFLRLNHYPVDDILEEEEKTKTTPLGDMALHHHTDAGVLTILLQDAVGGLQVQVGNDWIDVTPVENAFVVNVGDMMQVWSNDRYRAAVHRVRPIPGRSRYSIPFFFNPSYGTVCTPIVQPGEKALYRPVKWSEFRGERAKGDFGDYGTEIQISAFRI